MGGYVGLEYAVHYSDQLASLGLFFSTPEPDSTERKIMRDRSVALVKQNKNTFIRASMPQLFDPKSREDIKSDIDALIARALQMETQGVIAALHGMKKRVDRSSVLYTPPDNLKKSGAFVPGIRPGDQTSKYIDRILMRLTLVGAIYITGVCLLPEFLVYGYNVPFYFGGTSLLIIVVVTMDFMAQLQSYIMSQQYDSLLKKSSFRPGGAMR